MTRRVLETHRVYFTLRQKFANGVYYYEIASSKVTLANGKFVINH